MAAWQGSAASTNPNKEILTIDKIDILSDIVILSPLRDVYQPN